MYLKRIELQGFKSFPDRLSLEFDNVLAAIVGPNGSGKSNIADAIRWVLGEQSVKTLRGQKWEDVIFSGTQNRKPLNFAEVSITLDNTSREIDLEYTDVTVTRKVFRSGESEYLINGRNCRLKDVRELFMDTGIGKEGYSIIGQGQVDEILNTRSDDRRQIFEEASGIVKYKSRRMEAFTKLENEKKNLTRLNDIISEIEANIEPLKAQSETAKRFLELAERLKLYEVNLFILEERRLKNEIIKLEDIYNSNSELIFEKTELQNRCEEQLASLKSEIELLTGRITDLRERIYENRSAQEQKNNDIKINEANIDHFRKDSERLQVEIGGHNEKAKKNHDEITLFEAECSRERLLLNANEIMLLDIQEEFEKLSGRLTISEAEIEKHKSDIIEHIKSSSEIKSELSHLKQSHEQTEERSVYISEAKAKAAVVLENKQSAISALGNELMQCGEKRDELIYRRNSLVEEKNKQTEKRTELQTEYESAAKDVIKNKERLKVLTVMAQEHEGFFRSVKEILKAVSLGGLTGIRGVVGEVITVPKEYEIAVEIALGGSVQNIITDVEGSAKRAIEFLKRNNYGRATFLPIKTAKRQNGIPESVLAHDGIIGTAKNLIEFNEEFEPVMSGLLERVVIAKDMQTAIEFSRKTNYSYRVVTLGGELISAQGAITGGSLNEKRINVFSRNREITEIEEKLKRLYKIRDERQEHIKNADDKINEIKSALDSVYRETEETLLEFNTLEQRLSSENTELSALEKQAAEYEDEFLRIKKQLDELVISFDEKESLLKIIEAEEKEIEETMNEMQSLTQSDKELRDRKLSESANLRIKAAEINSRIMSATGNMDRLNAENEAIEENIRVCQADIEASEQRIRGTEKQTAALIIEIEKLKAYCLELETEIVEKETLKLKETKETEALAEEINSISTLISNITGENIRVEAKKERLAEEEQRLFNEMWDDYEITLKEARKYEVIDEPPSKMQRISKELKNEIKQLGNVNVSAIEQYKETKERFEFLSNQRNDILKAEEKLRGIVAELTELMEKTFREQFVLISESFNTVFREMFGGGIARLELSDKENPLESGIEIVAELPGKKLQSISLLSGGEKALTAIALLFGILKLNPSPFCILDEIEAALDDANIIRFANYLKKLRESMQFIVITHRKGTMESANVMYGVTMEEQGVSKLISVNLEEAVS